MRTNLQEHLDKIVVIYADEIKPGNKGPYTLLENLSLVTSLDIMKEGIVEPETGSEVIGFQLSIELNSIQHLWVSSAVFAQGIYHSKLMKADFVLGRVHKYYRKDGSQDYGLDPISKTDYHLYKLSYIHSHMIRLIHISKDERTFLTRLVGKPLWHIPVENVCELKKLVLEEIVDAENSLKYLLLERYRDYFVKGKSDSYKLEDLENIRRIAIIYPTILASFKKVQLWSEQFRHYVTRLTKYQEKKSKYREAKKQAKDKLKVGARGFGS